MKISSRQLENVIYKMRYQLLGYSNEQKDLVFEISVTQEDPGSGVMTDCLTIKATKPSTKDDTSETTMEVEIYPEEANVEPRASKTESFKITGKF